jgi:release factor glutamine methyltransferase
VLPRLVEELRLAGCVFAEDEAETVLATVRAGGGSPASGREDAALRDYVERRRRGEPAEYILGWAQVASLKVAVGPGVFIPRPWSETLVLRAASLLGAGSSGIAVDLGTGSGALVLAVRALVRTTRVWATEVDPVAAEWAERNFADADGLTVCRGGLYDALPRSLEHNVDVVFGSLPYVPSTELERLPRDHLVHEPLVAFDGGVQGLATVTRALQEAGRWLRPSGHILLEIGVGQGPAVMAIAGAAGFTRPVIHHDADGAELFLEAS